MKSILQNLAAKATLRNILLFTYIVTILGFSATSRATEVRFFPMPNNTLPAVSITQLDGLLLSSEDGLSGVLVQGEQVVAELLVPAHTDLNLVEFHGQNVELVAAASQLKVQPVIQGMSAQAHTSDGHVPTVFVLKIKGSL